jgi:hypothetical protein
MKIGNLFVVTLALWCSVAEGSNTGNLPVCEGRVEYQFYNIGK